MGYIMIIIFSLIMACIYGFVTSSISESKGYEGGFAWGFWLGIIGIIVVACKPINYAYLKDKIKSIDDEDWTCSNCGQLNDGFASECVKCGLKKPKQPKETLEIDEIMKLKQLLDAGAITQEEFDAKKKELLGL